MAASPASRNWDGLPMASSMPRATAGQRRNERGVRPGQASPGAVAGADMVPPPLLDRGSWPWGQLAPRKWLLLARVLGCQHNEYDTTAPRANRATDGTLKHRGRPTPDANNISVRSKPIACPWRDVPACQFVWGCSTARKSGLGLRLQFAINVASGKDEIIGRAVLVCCGGGW